MAAMASSASIARYDGFADYYAQHLRSFARRGTPVLVALLGPGRGTCLELGCGQGMHLDALAELGWRPIGLELSTDQLRYARVVESGGARRLVQSDAHRLPFADAALDAVCAAFIHTDLDHWASVIAEAARVVRPGGRVVYVGTHPCFVAPTSRYPGEAPPQLFPGYRGVGWSADGPGLGDGLRRRVGAHHLPLADLLNAFPRAGLRIEAFSEPGPEDYPRLLAVGARR
jgi:SAM-dependent methyltransferase